MWKLHSKKKRKLNVALKIEEKKLLFEKAQK
jgi:hypothetical protein